MSGCFHLPIFLRCWKGMAALLITLALPMGAGAAIAGGPVYTNAIASKQNLDTEFYRAAQSYPSASLGSDRKKRQVRYTAAGPG